MQLGRLGYSTCTVCCCPLCKPRGTAPPAVVLLLHRCSIPVLYKYLLTCGYHATCPALTFIGCCSAGQCAGCCAGHGDGCCTDSVDVPRRQPCTALHLLHTTLCCCTCAATAAAATRPCAPAGLPAVNLLQLQSAHIHLPWAPPKGCSVCPPPRGPRLVAAPGPLLWPAVRDRSSHLALPCRAKVSCTSEIGCNIGIITA
jgi:hypothetical protein